MRAAPITKQQYVYQTVRENILTGALEPGTRLTLADMSDRFGVSPIPIREALRQLEQEGLIEMTPHVKIVVRGVTVQEAIWVAQLRIVLEPPAAREAATHLTEADLAAMRSFVAEMEEHVAKPDHEAFARARFKFNDTLFTLLPNRRWHHTLMGLWETSQRYRNVFRRVDRIEESLVGVKDILEALELGDLDRIEQCYRERRRWSLDTLVAWAAQGEDVAEATAELTPMPVGADPMRGPMTDPETDKPEKKPVAAKSDAA